MKKLKLIISFILLVSLFLGVVACTPDEESKADVSEDVSDVVSEDKSETVSDDVSTDESEDEPEVSIDESIVRIRNLLKPYCQGEIILVDKYKGDRKLHVVTLSTSKKTFDDDVIADAFYDEYGLTFTEAFEKYCDDPEDYEKFEAALEKLAQDVLPLLPSFRDKMMDELKSNYDVDNIIHDERLIEDHSYSVVQSGRMSFYPYKINLLVYANETEAEALREIYTAWNVVALGEEYDWPLYDTTDRVYNGLEHTIQIPSTEEGDD